ncbi:MAG: response regulator [Firmicutes bacterium]|nr:response regulator [Bacillota bacterium]
MAGVIRDRDYLKEFFSDPQNDAGCRAIALLEMDHFQKAHVELGMAGIQRMMTRMGEELLEVADDGTEIIRYDDMTYVVILHHLSGQDEIWDRCVTLHQAVKLTNIRGITFTVSLGAAECLSGDKGCQIALDQALKALGEAQTVGDRVVLHSNSKEKKKTGVLVVEDQQMPAQLFASIIRNSNRYQLVQSIQSAEAAYLYCAQGNVDLVLMDVLTMMGANGLTASARIKKAFPRIKVIIVTSMPEVSYLDRAREAGVDSFWYKETQEKTLLEIMDRTMAGESVYPERPPCVKLGEAFSSDLTRQEVIILRELTTGATNVQIGSKLHIAPSTVKTYVERLMDKTGFRSRTELAVRARESGLVIPD